MALVPMMKTKMGLNRDSSGGKGKEEEEVAHEALLRSEWSFDPPPPDPLAPLGCQWLPGSAGRYRVVRQVRSPPIGGCSSVWLGERVSDGAKVALKHVVTDLWSGEREVSVHLAATGAPGVVPLIDAFWDRPLGEAGWTACRVLVMPWLTCLVQRHWADGQYQERLTLERLALGDVVKCARQLLECLVVLHEERRIVHLDIKPSNIFVRLGSYSLSCPTKGTTTTAASAVEQANKENTCHQSVVVSNACSSTDRSSSSSSSSITECLLGDFGLSRIVGIRILEPIGTHGFVPPEVQELTYGDDDDDNDDDDDDDDDDDNDNDDDDRQGLAVSPAQDIYSLGCTIMWLLERVVTPHGGQSESTMRKRKGLHALATKMKSYKHSQRPTARQALVQLKELMNPSWTISCS